MCRLVRITVFLVVLSLTGWAQNPFEQQAAADYTGVFVSQTIKLRLYGPADNIVGELHWSQGDKKYTVSGAVSDGMLRGTFPNGSDSFPFSLKQSGKEYAFVAGSEKATLTKLPALDLSGEWENLDGDLRVKVGDVEGDQVQGIVFFKGQKYVLTGTTSAAGIIGSFSSGGQTFPVTLLQSYTDNRLQFTTGSYSALLMRHYEASIIRKRQKWAERLDDPSLPELHAAAGRGDVSRIRELIAAGAKVDARLSDGRQPIHYAAWFGRTDAVRALVAEGADVEAQTKDIWEEPMIFAAQIGEVDTMRYLASQGASLTRGGRWCMSPIHHAAVNGSLEAIKYLLANGVSVKDKDWWGRQPIHLAARNGEMEVIRYLVSVGADVNAKGDDGDRPIHGASEGGHVEVIKYLASLGADINVKGSYGDSPIDKAAGEGHVDAIMCLVSLGVDAKQKDDHGRTPIHTAAYRDKSDAIRCLVKLGADVNAKDEEGKTPLDWAVQNSESEAAALLRELGGKSGK